jgi:hypothetical protein
MSTVSSGQPKTSISVNGADPTTATAYTTPVSPPGQAVAPLSLSSILLDAQNRLANLEAILQGGVLLQYTDPQGTITTQMRLSIDAEGNLQMTPVGPTPESPGSPVPPVPPPVIPKYIQFPRGPIDTPENHGAKHDVVAGYATMIAGSNTVQSTVFSPGDLQGGPGSKNIYVQWAGAGQSGGATSDVLPTSGQITSIPRNSGDAIPSGPIVITSGTNVVFFTVSPSGAPANAPIPILSQAAPVFAYPAGSTISFANKGIRGAIQSMAAGSATLNVTATNTVRDVMMWYGTDDTQAILAAFASPGHTLMGNQRYLADGVPQTTGNCNAILPIPGGLGQFFVLEGVPGLSGGVGVSSGIYGPTQIYTTRIDDTYGAMGPPSVLGGPTYEAIGQSLGPSVTIKDIEIILPDNPSIGGIDLSACAMATIEGKVAVTGGGIFTPNAQYGAQGQVNTHPWAFGLRLPQPANAGLADIKGFYAATNVYVGLVATEHMVVEHAALTNNVIGMGYMMTPAGGGHLSMLVDMEMIGCIFCLTGYTAENGVETGPTNFSPNYIYGVWDLEDQPQGQWSTFAHIVDTNNQFIGELTVLHAIVGGDLQNPPPLNIVGGNRLKVNVLGT